MNTAVWKICLPVLLTLFSISHLSCGKSPSLPSGAEGCVPPSAPAGALIKCPVSELGFSEDCTIFVSGTPVEATYLEEEGKVQFNVPSTLPGSKEILFQCGANDAVSIQNDFMVEMPGLPSSDQNEDPEKPSAPSPSGEACQDGPCVEGGIEGSQETPQPLPECFENADCGGEKVCEDNSCVPAPPPAPLEVAFVTTGSSKTEALHSTKLGLIRIKWKIQGGGNLQNAYIYGPFNRSSATEGCGKEFKRGKKTYLAVNPNGGEIIKGSPNYSLYQKYLTGETCDANSDNCQGFVPEEGDLTTCKIDLKDLGLGGLFYTRIHETARFVLAAQTEDGTWTFAEKEFEAPEPTIVASKVEISNSEPEVDIQFDYTNAREMPQVLGCTPVENQSPPSPPLPNGSGIFMTRCKFQLNEGNWTFFVNVSGIESTVAEKFEMSCGEPEITFTNGALTEAGSGKLLCAAMEEGWWNDCDKAGEIKFIGHTWRSCTVKKFTGDGQSLLSQNSQTVPWVRDLEMKAFDEGESCGNLYGKILDASSLPSGVSVTEGGKLEVTATLPRNHQCSRYQFGVRGSSGEEIVQVQKSFPYEAFLKVEGPFYDPNDLGKGSKFNGWVTDACQYDWPSDTCNDYDGSSCSSTSEDNGMWDLEDSCSNKGKLHPRISTWKITARHCKTIKTNCEEIIHTTVLDDGVEDSYTTINGTIQGWQSGIQCTLSCQFHTPDLNGNQVTSVNYNDEPCEPKKCVVIYKKYDLGGVIYSEAKPVGN